MSPKLFPVNVLFHSILRKKRSQFNANISSHNYHSAWINAECAVFSGRFGGLQVSDGAPRISPSLQGLRDLKCIPAPLTLTLTLSPPTPNPPSKQAPKRGNICVARCSRACPARHRQTLVCCKHSFREASGAYT